jgi:predicted nucleotidyltransferase
MPIRDCDLIIARELRERIAMLAPLVDFKVFGSRARGDATTDSDMDVFIELESHDKVLEEKILDIAWEVGYHNGCIHVSPLIFSRHEIEASPLRSSAIVRAIAAEGVRV